MRVGIRILACRGGGGLIVEIAIVHHGIGDALGVKVSITGFAWLPRNRIVRYEVVYCDVGSHGEQTQEAVDEEGCLGAEPGDEQAAEDGAAAPAQAEVYRLQDALCGGAQVLGHGLREERGGSGPHERMRHALDELEWQDPVGLGEQRHVHEAHKVAQQARVEQLHVTELLHQLVNEKVGHQLAHVIDDTGEAVERGRAAQVLQVPEEEREYEAHANAHEPDDKQKCETLSGLAQSEQASVVLFLVAQAHERLLRLLLFCRAC